MDAIKTYCPISLEKYLDIIEKTLKVIANHDIAMEINTSGKIKDILVPVVAKQLQRTNMCAVVASLQLAHK